MKTTTMASQWAKPQEVDDLTMAFGAGPKWDDLMPPMVDIPKDFRSPKWEGFMSDWFFGRLNNLKLVPKDGIDGDMALKHLRAIIGSFAPKHEHKEAAIAWLASLWFDDERILKERYAFAEASAQWCKEAGDNYHEAKRHEAEAKRNRRAFKLATLVAAILGSWLIVMVIWAVLR